MVEEVRRKELLRPGPTSAHERGDTGGGMEDQDVQKESIIDTMKYFEYKCIQRGMRRGLGSGELLDLLHTGNSGTTVRVSNVNSTQSTFPYHHPRVVWVKSSMKFQGRVVVRY